MVNTDKAWVSLPHFSYGGVWTTLLSGRYIKIDVFSLSFQEFLTFHNLEDSMDALVKYLK